MGLTCVIEPLLQQRLEFAHVLEAQVEGLEAGDGGLAEVVSIQLPHGQTYVPLVVRQGTARSGEGGGGGGGEERGGRKEERGRSREK